MGNFFSDADIPKLSENQAKFCEEDLTEKDLYNYLKCTQKGKYRGNDGLTKKFYFTQRMLIIQPFSYRILFL